MVADVYGTRITTKIKATALEAEMAPKTFKAPGWLSQQLLTPELKLQ